jgi:hypothetical protein
MCLSTKKFQNSLTRFGAALSSSHAAACGVAVIPPFQGGSLDATKATRFF